MKRAECGTDNAKGWRSGCTDGRRTGEKDRPAGRRCGVRACIRALLLGALLVWGAAGCGIYSFNGTSIQPDIKTITINAIENKAMKINPSLSNSLTEALQDKYRKMTKLEMVPEDGDLEISGTITNYDVTPTAITSQEIAAQNRLTITVQITFVNNKYPEESFTSPRSFAAFQDYNSELTLDQVEARLCEEIVEILTEDIFNATVANW